MACLGFKQYMSYCCFFFVCTLSLVFLLMSFKLLLHSSCVYIPDRNGGWGEWTSFSNCSADCGTTGTQSRSRLCDTPSKEGDGKDCEGEPSEKQSCNQILVRNMILLVLID